MDSRNNFDLLRLIGATLVVYGHSYDLNGIHAPGFAGSAINNIGLKIFFAVSGYLVSLSWMRDPHLARYGVRRAARILPGLIAVTLLAAFALGPLVTTLSVSDYVQHPLTWRYLKNILLYPNFALPGVFADNRLPFAVNGNLWTIPIEVAMYGATPLLLATLGRRSILLVALLIPLAAFAVWRIYIVPPTEQLVVYGTDLWMVAMLAPYYLSGMIIARIGRARLNPYLAFLLLLLVVTAQSGAVVAETMLIVCLPYAVLAFGAGPSLALIPRGMDLSYGIFLWSFPVQQTIGFASANTLGPWPIFLATMAVSGVLAVMSWTLIERPCLRMKPRRPGAETEGAAFGAVLPAPDRAG